jgi:hypothetical protein
MDAATAALGASGLADGLMALSILVDHANLNESLGR